MNTPSAPILAPSSDAASQRFSCDASERLIESLSGSQRKSRFDREKPRGWTERRLVPSEIM
jgi:hypothetical protein